MLVRALVKRTNISVEVNLMDGEMKRIFGNIGNQYMVGTFKSFACI